jgi:intraflagellar transport protein 172
VVKLTRVLRSELRSRSGDFQQFETLILRAQQPQLLLQGYKESGRWQDVLRVSKEYLPNRLESLKDEYDTHIARTQGVNAASLVTQGINYLNYSQSIDFYLFMVYYQTAREWELQGEFSRAVDCYFKVYNGDNVDFLNQNKLVKLIHFLRFVFR